jgi:predicted nucleotidyltransferase
MDRDPGELDVAVRAALVGIDAVRVAYFFGSRTRRGARIDSDLDIAVAFAPTADARSRERTRRAIVAALTDSLGTVGERADVVDLEECDSAVAFNAVRTGRPLLARSPAERVRIETRIARRYDDDAPKRVLFRLAAREAVARLQAK